MQNSHLSRSSSREILLDEILSFHRSRSSRGNSLPFGALNFFPLITVSPRGYRLDSLSNIARQSSRIDGFVTKESLAAIRASFNSSRLPSVVAGPDENAETRARFGSVVFVSRLDFVDASTRQLQGMEAETAAPTFVPLLRRPRAAVPVPDRPTDPSLSSRDSCDRVHG